MLMPLAATIPLWYDSYHCGNSIQTVMEIRHQDESVS